MTKHQMLSYVAGAVTIVACAASPGPVFAQSLASRVNSAPTSKVQFEFAPRAGVCGDGLSFLSSGSGSSYHGSVTIVNGISAQPCAPGPVRVVLDRAEGIITNIETVAGPLHPADGATDIGTVSGREAADFLMAIATKTDGSAARAAILPAGLADGADIAPSLIAIARDQNRPIDIRRTALSWLARDDDANTDARTATATDLLLSIARNDNETQALRRTALGLLARVGHGTGVPALMRLATDNSSTWIGQESLRAISQSEDPRARTFLRKELANTELPDAMLVETIRALAGPQATGADISLLRSTFASTSSAKAREAILETMAQRGTSTDTQWLLGVARNANETPEIRRRAIQLASRGTAGSTQLLELYDTMDDATLKSTLIEIYAQTKDRASVDKLISIAKTDSDYALRRRAIASLARTDDPRAKTALQEISAR
ncbi:MAG: HEAT repeat domain-containing protein [Gemmatimonadaceae bacterium]